MDALAGSPLTLVVKAPNQEIGDQTVECFLDWTVRKLKRHLSAVYPTNPNERNQRIIYSGKLLQDNVLLKDVLSASDAQDKCTVHLVCTPSSEDQAKRKPSGTRRKEAEVVRPSRPTVLTPSSSTNSSSSSSSTDGLRQRTTATTQQQHEQQQQQQPVFPNATYLPSTAGTVPGLHPGVVPPSPSASMTNEQLQWLQHVYAQQMAAYMQYASMMAAGSSGMQAAGWAPGYPMGSPWFPPTGPHPTTSTTPLNEPHPHAPHQQVPGGGAPAANAPPPQAAPAAAQPNPGAAAAPQPQRMNVGGGQVMGDDEAEEGVRRDWLDWTFTLCRFGILLSIVYFYSSLHRFIMVAGAVFVMYLYQAGFFRLRRRQRVRPPVTPPQEPQPEPPREGDNTPESGAAESADAQDESDGSTSSSDDADGGGAEVDEPAEPPPPGLLATSWVFISTFFTSIVPQGPPQQFPAN